MSVSSLSALVKRFYPRGAGWLYLAIVLDLYSLAVVGWSIEVFYNHQRCHSTHDYLAPPGYEQAVKTNGILCPGKC
jgi:transposase InsO family protein